ncbi:uncharacterized protein [Anabrus simplex]|uniref:uncharacterized protein n=1 Tax=Anabrus simplex TaxID=316456 RepID=UPI0035A35F2C
MKTVLIIFATATLVQSIMAAISTGPTKIDPNNPNNCLDHETGKSFPIGEYYYPHPDECYVAICSDDTFETQSCGIGRIKPGEICHIKKPRKLPYPECCTDCIGY